MLRPEMLRNLPTHLAKVAGIEITFKVRPCVFDITHEHRDPVGCFMQPWTQWIGGWTEIPSVCVRVPSICAGWEEGIGVVFDASFDATGWRKIELRRVGIVSVDVCGSFDRLFLC